MTLTVPPHLRTRLAPLWLMTALAALGYGLFFHAIPVQNVQGDKKEIRNEPETALVLEVTRGGMNRSTDGLLQRINTGGEGQAKCPT
ncbi:MAG: hypothetical protein PHV34_21805 [Verrucomicrobiae bacterium]|nr:hypothetical protein [Verrucomicrobiae bacterium]